MSKCTFTQSTVLFQILNISDTANKQKWKNTNVLESSRKYQTRQLRSDELKDNVTNKAPGQVCFTSERKDSASTCSSELEDRMEGNETLYKSDMQDDKVGGILSSNIEGIQCKVGSERLLSFASATFSGSYHCTKLEKIIPKNLEYAMFTAELYIFGYLRDSICE